MAVINISTGLEESFLDMMPDTIGILDGTTPKDGSVFVPSGDPTIDVKCLIEGEIKTIKSGGRELAITHTVTLGGYFSLFVASNRFVFPDRYYSPESEIGYELEAKLIEQVNGNDGPAYEIVMFGLA